jgi:hypothetical protein
MKFKDITTSFKVVYVMFALLAITSGCAAVKQALSSPAGTTNAPPVSTALNQGAAALNAITAAAPNPWTPIASQFLTTLSALFAAYAAYHAKKAAGSSAEAATQANQANAPPPSKA